MFDSVCGTYLDPSDVATDAEALRSFVKDFLTVQGASCRDLGDRLEARLPKELARALDVPHRAIFVFDARRVGRDEIVVAHGAPVFHVMLELARREGTACSLIFAGLSMLHAAQSLCAENLWESSKRGDGPRPPVELVNGRVNRCKCRLLFYDELIFVFRVAFMSDERIEELHRIAVDPLTEEAAVIQDVKSAVSLRLPQLFPVQEDAGQGVSYAVQRLYQRACEHLASRIERRCRVHERAAAARRAREEERIRHYYTTLAAEAGNPLRGVLRRITREWARTALLYRGQTQGTAVPAALRELERSAIDLRKAYEAELKALQAEQERRLAELEERFRLRVEARLVSAARVKVPCLEFTVTVAEPCRTQITLLYDVLRQKVREPGCDGCGKPLAEARVCTCGNLLCLQCHLCSCGKSASGSSCSGQ